MQILQLVEELSELLTDGSHSHEWMLAQPWQVFKWEPLPWNCIDRPLVSDILVYRVPTYVHPWE